MNATKNETTMVANVETEIAEKLDALYADLCRAKNGVLMYAEMLRKEEAKYTDIETRILELEKKMAEEKAKKNEAIDPKTEQRRAARAVGRENKAKYARWEKEAKKKLPVFDRPNHVVAYAYYDENGVLLGRKPASK